MLKKTIQLCITFISSFILCFILLYAFLINKLEKSNATLVISITISILFAISFCNIRNILLLKKQNKLDSKIIENEYKNHALYMTDDDFYSEFIKFNGFSNYSIIQNCIIVDDHIYGIIRQLSEVSADQILNIIRLKNTMPQKETSLLIIAPHGDLVAQMISDNKINILPEAYIQNFIKINDEKNYTITNTPKRNFRKILNDKIFGQKCFRYGIILFILSLFSLYKFWYIFIGTVFIILSVASLMIRKRHQSKTMV